MQVYFYDINPYSKQFGKQIFHWYKLTSRITSVNFCPFGCHFSIGCWNHDLLMYKINLTDKNSNCIILNKLNDDQKDVIVCGCYSYFGEYFASVSDDKNAYIYC